MSLQFRIIGVLLLLTEKLLALGMDRLELSCLTNQIQVNVTTLQDFKGVIYTQGSYRQDGCYLNAEGGTQFTIFFSLNECQTKQKNAQYSNVLIIQHEDELITKDDHAFNIQCDYKLQEKVLELQRPLNVSKPVNSSFLTPSEISPVASISPKNLHVFHSHNIASSEEEKNQKINSISNNSNVAIFNANQSENAVIT